MAVFSSLILLAIIIVFGYAVRIAIYKTGGFNRRVYNITIKIVISLLLLVTLFTLFLDEPQAVSDEELTAQQIQERQTEWQLFTNAINNRDYAAIERISSVQKVVSKEFAFTEQQLRLLDERHNSINAWIIEVPPEELQGKIRVTYYEGSAIINNREIMLETTAPAIRLEGETLFVQMSELEMISSAVMLEYPIAQFVDRSYSLYHSGMSRGMSMQVQNVLVVEIPTGTSVKY